MTRHTLVVVLLLSVSASLAATTVIVNGDTVTLPVIAADGKAFVDVAALMKLLGGKATYDAAADKLYINSTGGAPQPPAKLADFGTAQLPGDLGVIGQVYKLRTSSPLYFRLNSAEYSVSQLRFGRGIVIPKADEKLLILHFSVQNPQKVEVLVRFDSLRFTAVDATDVNHEGKGMLGDEKTHGDLNMRLKPAQRIEAYACIVVPASGVIPKLMVLPGTANDGPVVRYDLRDQVTPLPAPIADPADPSGATALETVPAQLGTPCSLRNFDVTVEGFEMVTGALDRAAPPEGASYCVATLLCKNKTAIDAVLRFDTFISILTDTGGQQLKRSNDLLGATANVAFNQKVRPDEEVRVRTYFTVPKDDAAKGFSIQEGDSRTYQFEVAQ